MNAYEYRCERHVIGEVETRSVRMPRDVVEYVKPIYENAETERMSVVLLNSKNLIMGVETVYLGNVSAALVRVGELFRAAVRINAVGLILVHNHPSGDPEPSPDDMHLTAEAVAAGRLLDIPVLDHVVLGDDFHGHVSLRDRGLMPMR